MNVAMGGVTMAFYKTGLGMPSIKHQPPTDIYLPHGSLRSVHHPTLVLQTQQRLGAYKYLS